LEIKENLGLRRLSMSDLRDLVAEKSVLSAIFKHGSEVHSDISDIVQVKSFESTEHQIVYKVVQHICENQQVNQVDIPNFLSTAKSLGFQDNFCSTDQKSWLQSVVKYPCDKNSIRHLAGKVGKLAVARLLDEQLLVCREKLHGISGEETLSNILGLVENPIIDFSSLICKNDSEPKEIFKNAKEYLTFLADNPVKQVGISSGYENYDEGIGGGFREGTVNMVGARLKIGKSSFASNVGLNVSGENIPTFLGDTEMDEHSQLSRMLASISSVPIKTIETGQFKQNTDYCRRLREATDRYEKLPFSYKSIAGQPFEETIATMRRWLFTKVGLNKDKKAKKCLIIFDYLKLMNDEGIKSGNIQEFQALGFMMSTLHNFAVKYGIPILSFVQLNRDGIDKESTDIISGSDRIGWLCSNLSILRPQSDEEFAAQYGNKIKYNRKLITIAARHGGGHSYGDYINMNFNGDCCQFKEGPTKFQIETNQKSHLAEGEITNGDSINEIL